MKTRLFARLLPSLAVLLSLAIMPLSIQAAGLAQSRDAGSDDRVPIRWFIGLGAGSDSSMLAAQQHVADDFNVSQSAIHLVLDVADNAVASQVLEDEILSGNAPDIIGPLDVEAGNPFNLLDLTPLISAAGYNLDDFNPEVIDVYTGESGRLFGLPLMVHPSFIYYNKALFDQAGLTYPPHQYGQLYVDSEYGGMWTFDKLAEISRRMTLDNAGKNSADLDFDPAHIVQYGYVPQWTNDPLSIGTPFGANRFIDPAGNAQIPLNWRSAFHWYYSGMWGGQPFIPSQVVIDDAYEGNAFSSGKIAMANTHLWYTCCLDTGNVPDWDIAAMPSYNNTTTAKLHTNSFSILQASKHPDEAFEVLQYLLGTAAETLIDTYTEGSVLSLPARISLQEEYVDDMQLRYPSVDWQVMLDSIAYTDHPYHQSAMPNYRDAAKRIKDFGTLMNYNSGLDLDGEMEKLLADLQWIFDKHYFLPVLKR